MQVIICILRVRRQRKACAKVAWVFKESKKSIDGRHDKAFQNSESTDFVFENVQETSVHICYYVFLHSTHTTPHTNLLGPTSTSKCMQVCVYLYTCMEIRIYICM
ncbi:hypothetical protein TGARI_372080 [Toxoplasma gondii ARI]|uniref:Uncharacterized protein n=1 Tax=Toxoplasma gondii ARI TaxID=1074872 RepID=A0A139XJ43_TOXGO|nr:hypothetical protein TGARI_372080 [Toxoplasma gondii ARI]